PTSHSGTSTSGGAQSEIRVSPVSGPIGATMHISSVRPCPALPAGDAGPVQVYITFVDPRRVVGGDNGDIDSQFYPVQSDRSWFADMDVTDQASVGPSHLMISCYAHEPGIKDPDSYFVYPVEPSFTVTSK